MKQVFDSMKHHPPQIILVATLTAPYLLNPEECGKKRGGLTIRPKFDHRNGIVQVRRFQIDAPYKRNYGEHRIGESRLVEGTINEENYCYIMGNDHDSIAVAVEKYHNLNGRVDDGIRYCNNGVPERLTTASIAERKQNAEANPEEVVFQEQYDQWTARFVETSVNLERLREYCRVHRLCPSGNSSVVKERIIATSQAVEEFQLDWIGLKNHLKAKQ